MTEELEQLLKNLHLNRIAEIIDDETRRADRDQPPYQEFLLRLIRPQWHAKQEKALQWRVSNAKLPELLTLETFPFKIQTGVNRRQIRTFAELDFIPKAENIVFICGRCKTVTGDASSELRTSSTRCTPHWPTALPGSS
jgi:DNA replication protein DnaC